MEFAFMFIPSEAIYYDLLVNKVWTLKNSSSDLIEYAFKEKKVIITSPTSFYAYLQTVMQWLRALQIEKKAVEIKKHIEKLSFHLKNYEEYFNKIWNSLWTTVNHFNSAWSEFKKIDKDIVKISSWDFGGDIEIKVLDKVEN
jgi:DNA recombination protein RmuC